VHTYTTPQGVIVADKDSDLMAEFQEFLTQKRESEQAQAESEDYDVEIWDEKGRGARVRRSHAKPFLQTLGIDTDDESGGNGDGKEGDATGGDSPKSNRKSTGSKSASNAASGTSSVRKYFTKKA
jgi:hypothetical protein